MGVVGTRRAIFLCSLLYIESGKSTGLEQVAFVAKNIVWKGHFRQVLLSGPSYTNQVLQPELCPGRNVRKTGVTQARAPRAAGASLGASELLPTKELLPPGGEPVNLITHWVLEQPAETSGVPSSISDPVSWCR